VKRTSIFHPILFGIYPIVFLYALMPGGIPLDNVIRPLVIQVSIILAMLVVLSAVYKERFRAAIMTSFIVVFFTSTGYIYRTLPKGVFHPLTHMGLVVLGFVIILILNHPLLWTKYLPLTRRITLTPILNLIAALSLVYPSYRIGSVLVDSADDIRTPWNEIIQRQIPPQILTTSDTPDIYYIILDGYTRADALQDIYGFDNQNFIEALHERGFYVAEQSRSNYIRTVVSLPSSLNMSYVNFAEDQAGWRSVNYLPLYDLIRHGQVQTMLQNIGYSIVAFDSDFPFTDWKDADTYLSPYSVNISEFERVFLGTTAMGAFFDTGLPFSNGLRALLPLPSYETRRTKIRFAFDQVRKIPEIGGHKFVFVHIIAPHPPFVFDRDGAAQEFSRPFANLDGENYKGTEAEYLSQYTEQLQFVNTNILLAIDSILANSSRPPIIIIQGDHGGGSHLDPSSLDTSCMFERVSILNAYYLPGGKTDLLYPSITPVNTFRVVFNAYFGTNYPMLPDRTYYSPHVNPYDFVDISEEIEATCQTP